MIDISDESKQPSQPLSPMPVVSDIPLVVSDIPYVVTDTNGATAPPPQLQTQTQPSKLIEKGAQRPPKRKGSPKMVRIIGPSQWGSASVFA